MNGECTTQDHRSLSPSTRVLATSQQRQQGRAPLSLRTGSRLRARFLLSTRLTLFISAEPTSRSTSKGEQLATTAANKALMLQACPPATYGTFALV